LRHTPGHIIDIVPTILELTGAKHPATWKDQPVPTAPGISLVPLFKKDGTVSHNSIWWMHEENRAFRMGDWKIVAAGKESPWELYDLSTDRSESKNLAAENPEKVRNLAEQWTKQAQEYFTLAGKDLPKSSKK
jgi:arylsulfatase